MKNIAILIGNSEYQNLSKLDFSNPSPIIFNFQSVFLLDIFLNILNKSSKLLDCKVQSVGSGNIDGHFVIIVRIECEDLNDCKNFFKKD